MVFYIGFYIEQTEKLSNSNESHDDIAFSAFLFLTIQKCMSMALCLADCYLNFLCLNLFFILTTTTALVQALCALLHILSNPHNVRSSDIPINFVDHFESNRMSILASSERQRAAR